MSRRLLVAAGGSVGGGGGPVDPDDPDAPPQTSDWPTTADITVLALRPEGRTLAARYATNDAQVTEADDILQDAVFDAGLAGGYSAWGDPGPDYSTRLVLAPGTYVDSAITAWRAVVGAGGPGNRTIIDKPGASGGAVHSYGAAYMENLHMVGHGIPNETGPKYPWHITGGPYSVAVNCTFDCSGYESATAFVGADGSSGHLIVLYKCDFIALAGDDGSFNIHGPGDSSTPALPLSLVFIDCIGLDDVALSVPAGVAGNGEGSTLHVINTPCASIGGTTGTHVYTDGDAPASGTNAATIHRDVTSWTPPEHAPLPDNDEGYDYYYPSAITSPPTTQRIDGVTTAPFQPVSGRTYLTRVHLDQAMRVTHCGVTLTTAAGNVKLRPEPANTLTGNPPGDVAVFGGGQAAALGDVVYQHQYARTRYPGSPGIWVGMQFDNTTVRVTGSTQIPAGDMYYTDDGTTFTPVTPGTLHPLAFVRGT